MKSLVENRRTPDRQKAEACLNPGIIETVSRTGLYPVCK
jgi:hypothetical protein